MLPVVSAGGQSVSYHPAARQIATAVSPLPEPLQKGAKVMGYDPAGKFTTLRKGTNDMVCIADDPTGERYHVACYHKSLEPFKEQMVLFTGLNVLPADDPKMGAGNHERAAGAFLSGVTPRQGPIMGLAKTLDQYIVDKIGQDTPLRSLQLSTESDVFGVGAG